MKDLSKWQLVSFVSRGLAMAAGLVKSFFILRILTVGEWGVIQLALGIGGALGIYQHLGLASASTREISTAKKELDVFKIFFTSAVIRYAVTLPIAAGLFFASDYLATKVYSVPEMAHLLKIYALILVVQGGQSILNSVIAGTKRFKQLFIYQAVISVVSVFLYIPLVYKFRVEGYFYAFAAFSLISTITLTVLAFRPYRSMLQFPTFKDFKILFKDIFSISIGIYLVKIIYTNWEKFGPNTLGLFVDAQVIGIYGFALLYGKKLMAVSDAVTDVNLPVLSDKYVNNIEEFKSMFAHNFNRIFSLILLGAIPAVYWVREFVNLVVGSGKYDAALGLVLPISFAFVFYSFINIITASVVIPAKMVKEMILGYVLMILTTALFYFATLSQLGHLLAMAYGMFTGGMAGLLFLIVLSQIKLNFKYFNHDHYLILLQCLVIAYMGFINGLLVKVVAYLLFLVLFFAAIYVSGFVKGLSLRRIVLRKD